MSTPLLTRHQQARWPLLPCLPHLPHLELHCCKGQPAPSSALSLQGTALPDPSVQLQPQRGQASSRLLLTHLRGLFKWCQAASGSARNVENAERNPKGADAADLLGQPQQGCSLCIPGGPARLPRQHWCVPTGCGTGDRKLWPVFVWQGNCLVLDPCRKESRTDTSSTHLVETHLRTHGTFPTQLVLLSPKHPFPYLC